MKVDLVKDLSLIIPERGRLAKMMARKDPLTELEMRQAMQDIYSLCAQDFTVLYRPGENPVDGACPVNHCRMKMKM